MTPEILKYGFYMYMLNVALVNNDIEWRPIVKFCTLIDNMNRTGLYDGHIF